MMVRRGRWLGLVATLAGLAVVPRAAEGATITVAAAAPQGPQNCIPFGGYSSGGYAGFVYQNLPAFRLLPGDRIMFDLGLQNEQPIVVDIALAATTVNGGDVPVAFTPVVIAGTASPATGDSVPNNFELAFTVANGFDFAGGGLIVRIRAAGTFAADTDCTQVLMGGAAGDASGFFVKRVFSDPDGVPPWTSEDPTAIGQVRFVTSDDDRDGIGNSVDNCATIFNPDQLDTESDGMGNVCDGDDDGDAVADGADNCSLVANPMQQNTDADGAGDACDDDDDGDSVPDLLDNCVLVVNPGQEDANADGTGDACETDGDGDGVDDGDDNCPAVANTAQSDTDDDAVGDTCDDDLDGDGATNRADNCPAAANPDQADGDDDGVGDDCDPVDGGGSGAGGEGGAGTGGSAATTTSGSSTGAGPGATGSGGEASAGGGGPGTGGASGDGDASGTGGAAGGGADDGGCGCHLVGGASPVRSLMLVALGALGLVTRRRSRRAR